MISCTEFIPLYSELFKFLEDKCGKEEVDKYWEFVSEKYVQPRLGTEIEKAGGGLMGCWNYWSKSLNEEACDFEMTCDEENNFFKIDMRGCPSKGMLLKLGYTNPYKNYCGHCDVLYRLVAAKYGIKVTTDLSHCDEARCTVCAEKIDFNKNK